MVWCTVSDLSPDEAVAFSSRKVAMALPGEIVNDSKTSIMKKVKVADKYYYLKRYFRSGKYLRRFIGSSRVRREWVNACWFENHGIPIPRRIAFGEGNRLSADYWGIIITEEVTGAVDLRHLYRDHKKQFEDRKWRLALIERLAGIVRSIHAQNFIHNDLQWRNLLVEFSQEPEVYIIDSPAGRKIILRGNRRGIIKDLALLDKQARAVLSRSERLRFYLSYLGIDRLQEPDKKEIRRILKFFDGRAAKVA